jgi:hypothetical protein
VARQADLLPVEYFHVVFTVPQPIAAIAYQDKSVVYGMVFEVAIETLRTTAADPKHLGAEIGLIAVLHTWGQTPALHRAGGWPLSRCNAMDCMSTGLLPTGTRSLVPAPPPVLGKTYHRPSCEAVTIFR